MTDNRTTELRAKLTERGIEYTTNDHMGVCETSWNGFTAMQLTPGAKLIMTVTPEQAIAATLGAGECELVETESYRDANEVIHVLECSACGEICEHVNGSYSRCPHCGRKAVER